MPSDEVKQFRKETTALMVGLAAVSLSTGIVVALIILLVEAI